MSKGNLDSYTLAGVNSENRKPLTGSGSSPATNNFADADAGNNLKSKLATLTSAAITLSHDNTTSTSLYVTMTFSDGTISELYGTNTDLRWDAGIGTIESINVNDVYVKDTYLFRGTVGKDNAFALNAAALVPEPTTATLSLLALAALAARRRRR